MIDADIQTIQKVLNPRERLPISSSPRGAKRQQSGIGRVA